MENKVKKVKKVFVIIIAIVLSVSLLGAFAVLGIDARVKSVGKSMILTEEEAAKLEGVDCILVLGCKVNGEAPS